MYAEVSVLIHWAESILFPFVFTSDSWQNIIFIFQEILCMCVCYKYTN